jgi:hypothetical protein
MDVVALISTVLDSPAIQGPAASFCAAFLKAKLPPGAEKDIKDFLAAVAAAL